MTDKDKEDLRYAISVMTEELVDAVHDIQGLDFESKDFLYRSFSACLCAFASASLAKRLSGSDYPVEEYKGILAKLFETFKISKEELDGSHS